MTKALKDVYLAFDGKLVGKQKLKYEVCHTLSLLPEKYREKVTKTCWFMGSTEDAWAFTFTGNDLKNQHLIFLSDELFSESEDQIHYTITHEIAHVLLKHRNSTLEKQKDEEIKKQEAEADFFVKTYLRKNPH